MWQLHFFWFWWGLFSTMAHVFPFNWRLEVTTSRPETSQLHIQLTLPVWQQWKAEVHAQPALLYESPQFRGSSEVFLHFKEKQMFLWDAGQEYLNAMLPLRGAPASYLLTPLLSPLSFTPSSSSQSSHSPFYFLFSPFLPPSHQLIFLGCLLLLLLSFQQSLVPTFFVLLSFLRVLVLKHECLAAGKCWKSSKLSLYPSDFTAVFWDWGFLCQKESEADSRDTAKGNTSWLGSIVKPEQCILCVTVINN